jgi:hypothetical protein
VECFTFCADDSVEATEKELRAAPAECSPPFTNSNIAKMSSKDSLIGVNRTATPSFAHRIGSALPN